MNRGSDRGLVALARRQQASMRPRFMNRGSIVTPSTALELAVLQ